MKTTLTAVVTVFMSLLFLSAKQYYDNESSKESFGVVEIADVEKKILIPYRKGNLWGYSDSGKNLVLPLKYDSARHFVGKYAPVKMGEKWTFIDSAGNPQTAHQYDDISILNNEFFLVRIGTKKGKMVHGVLSSVLTSLVPVKYETVAYSEPLFHAYGYDKYHQYMNHYFTKFGGRFEHGFATYSEGLLIVQNAAYKYGAVETSGYVKIPFSYSYLSTFNLGTAVARNGEQSMLITKTNDLIWISKLGVDDITPSNALGGKNILLYDNKAKTLVLENESGQRIDLTKEKFDPIFLSGTGFKGLAYARNKKDFGLLNAEGKFTPICKVGDVTGYKAAQDGLACVSIKGLIGYIDSTGTMVIQPQFKYNPKLYNFNTDFKDGFALMNHNGKFGAIDTKGNAVVPLKYESIERAGNGLFVVKYKKKTGYVNAAGTEFWDDK